MRRLNDRSLTVSVFSSGSSWDSAVFFLFLFLIFLFFFFFWVGLTCAHALSLTALGCSWRLEVGGGARRGRRKEIRSQIHDVTWHSFGERADVALSSPHFLLLNVTFIQLRFSPPSPLLHHFSSPLNLLFQSVRFRTTEPQSGLFIYFPLQLLGNSSASDCLGVRLHPLLPSGHQ